MAQAEATRSAETKIRQGIEEERREGEGGSVSSSSSSSSMVVRRRSGVLAMAEEPAG